MNKNRTLIIVFLIFAVGIFVLSLKLLNLRSLTLNLKEIYYQYDELDVSKLEVYECKLFTKDKVTDFSVDNVELDNKKNMISVSYDGLKESLYVNVIPLVAMQAEYTIDKIYLGDNFSPENLLVELLYQDDTVFTVEDYNLINTPGSFVFGDNTIDIDSKYGTVSLAVTPITVVSIDVKNDIYYGLYDDVECNIIFEDGYIRHANITDVIDTSSLNVGINKIKVNYYGQNIDLEIEIMEKTNIMKAMDKYSGELEAADYSHISDTTFITITKQSISGVSYYLSHVVINDSSQIKAGLSYDDYGGSRETVSSAMQRLGGVLGINASYFSYSTGKPISGVKIKNGEICSDSARSTHAYYFEMCLTKDGELFEAEEGQSAQDLLNKGVTDTFITADPILIDKGNKSNLVRSWDGYHYDGNMQLCRTTIGMVEPCDYYIVTATNGAGLGLYALQDIFYDIGCSYAQGLDGGGSSTLVFEGVGINRNEGNQRGVVDFLYFL